MLGDYSRDLLRQGIIELKGGDRSGARRYLDRALYMSTDHDVLAEAWYWMSQTTDDPAERRSALENCLANDLHYAEARRALAILDGRLKPDEIINPNRPPNIPQDRGAVQRFVCPKCGGRMSYAPDGGSLVCEYCRRHQALTTQPVNESDKDFILAMATLRGHGKPLREQVRRCQGCGAEFILPAKSLSFNCPYCESPQVVKIERSQGLIEPHGIIPHSFDQRRAADLLTEWLHGMKIEAEGATRAPRGLYVPIWSFQLAGAIRYTGEVSRKQGNAYADISQEMETIHGDYPVLMDISVAGSRRPSAPLVRLIADFNARETRPYDAGFLAAWPAELYDISMADASLEARGLAYARLKRDLPTLLAPVRILSTSSEDLSIHNFRLDLLPVWAAELFVDGRGGIALINGKTGAVSGDSLLQPAKRKEGITAWLKDLLWT